VDDVAVLERFHAAEDLPEVVERLFPRDAAEPRSKRSLIAILEDDVALAAEDIEIEDLYDKRRGNRGGNRDFIKELVLAARDVDLLDGDGQTGRGERKALVHP